MLNSLQRDRANRELPNATRLAEGTFQFEAAGFSGGFLRPGEVGIGGDTGSTAANKVGQSQRISNGTLFNRIRASKYAHNEVYVENGVGGYYILDSYNPGSEIVSRKFTQLSEVKVATAKSYIREVAAKYKPGTRIANVASTSRQLAGQQLKGELYLEVPIQAKPVPKSILNEASKYDVTIRDVNGKVYTP